MISRRPLNPDEFMAVARSNLADIDTPVSSMPERTPRRPASGCGSSSSGCRLEPLAYILSRPGDPLRGSTSEERRPVSVEAISWALNLAQIPTGRAVS
jgi:hypothetical protein